MKITKLTILISVAFFCLPITASAATEFVSKIAPDGDYYQLSTWESSVQTDLTSAGTRVFSGTPTGTLSQGDIVTVVSSTGYNSATATVVATTQAGQILVQNASMDSIVLNNGDTLEKDASNYWTVQGSGNELGDTAIAVAECYKGDYSTVGTGGVNYINSGVTINGSVTNSENYLKITVPASERHNGTIKNEQGNYTGFTILGSSFALLDEWSTAEGLILDFNNTPYHVTIGNWTSGGNNSEFRDGILLDPVYRFFIVGDYRTAKIYNNFLISQNREYGMYSIFDLRVGNSAKIWSNTIFVPEGTKLFQKDMDEFVNNIVYMKYKNDNYGANWQDYNITNLSFASGDNSINNVSLEDIGFLNTSDGSEDLHIGVDSVAVDEGYDLSQIFSTDIDGGPRPSGKFWDIGADEAAPDFVSKIKPGSEPDSDYTKLSTWEAAIESDLTASTSRVMTVSDRGTYDRSIDNGSEITFSNSATGTLIDINSDDVLYASLSTTDITTGTVTVSGSGNTFTISNTGAQIGRAIAEVYKGDYSESGGGRNYIADHVTIDGWTTGENNYVKVYTPQSERHNGILKDDSGDYTGFTMVDDADYIDMMDIRNSYTTIDGIATDYINNSYSLYYCIDSQAAYTVFTNNLLANHPGNRSCIGVRSISNTVVNNIVYNSNNAGIHIDDYGGHKIYNNTVVNSNIGINESTVYSDYLVKNNLTYNNTNGDFVGLNSSATIQNNASSDGTADDFGGTGNRVNQTFTFKDEANDDFHLSISDTGAKDRGVELTNDPYYPFCRDIDGEARPSGKSWDIGADELYGSENIRIRGGTRIEGGVRIKKY